MAAVDVDFDATLVTPVPPPPPRSGETGGTNSLETEGYAVQGMPFLEADSGGTGSMRLPMATHEYVQMLLDVGVNEAERAQAIALSERLDLWAQGFFILRASVVWPMPAATREVYFARGVNLLRMAERTVQI